MTTIMKVGQDILDTWATDPGGPVALHLKQELLPVGSVGDVNRVVFPPTYADIGYNIDTLSDGSAVATVDSVGSQANRIEPIFKAAADKRQDWLVPQLEIEIHDGERLSILDLAHRAGDAVVRASNLAPDIEKAFQELRKTGDVGPLCKIAPTSLLFGVWDSRGTHEKRPRLVRALIRAWDVEPLHSTAQFTSAWKALDEAQRTELENEAKARKVKLSEKGFADAPAVFRKTPPQVLRYRDGAANPAARVLGGVLVRGRIEREVTVNLIALRGLRGNNDEETGHIHKYLLGLSLVAATADIDLYLREGCHLHYAGEDEWCAVPRRGEPRQVDLSSADARALIQDYARNASGHFRNMWPAETVFKFDIKKAKLLLANKEDDETGE
ncbi:MAG: type I-U CRISPR-associated RAMP protein Csb1/Cas7u [Dehalococcoidia bacterium]